jgi:hypothetical protein
MSRSGLFDFENEPIWLIHDSNIFFNRFGRTASVIRDTRFGIGRTVPAIRDTHVRLVVLVIVRRARRRTTDFVQMPSRLSIAAWAWGEGLLHM